MKVGKSRHISLERRFCHEFDRCWLGCWDRWRLWRWHQRWIWWWCCDTDGVIPIFPLSRLIVFLIFDAEVDWRLSTAYLVCRGRLSRSLTSCFSLKTVSWAARRLWEKSTFWMAEPVLRVRASPSRGKAGTALDLMKSGAAPWAALRSFLAGKCSQEARPKS